MESSVCAPWRVEESCRLLRSQNGNGGCSSFSVEVGVSEQQATISLEQAARGSVEIEVMVAGAEEGDEAIHGASLDPEEAWCADDHAQLEFHGRWERRVVPYGVDNDVGDWVERAVAVTSHEKAALVEGAELAGRQPGEGLEVEPMDGVQEHPPQAGTGVLVRDIAGERATRHGQLPRSQQGSAAVVHLRRRLAQKLLEVAEAGGGGAPAHLGEETDGLVEAAGDGEPEADEAVGVGVLGGERGAPKGHPKGLLDGGPGGPEPLHAAVHDDDAGGDEEVGAGQEQVAHGLAVGEVGEEAGEEGNHAVQRPALQLL